MSSLLNQFLSPILRSPPSVSPDMEIEILSELPVETLYLALKASDHETTQWFFENASPEQVQGLVDIDCWEGSMYLPERFENYFKSVTLVSPEKLAEYLNHLDPENWVRAIIEYCEVLDFDPQNPPEVDESRFLLSLDNRYALILKNDNPEIRELLYLWLNKASAGDMNVLRRHLESCKWELPSDLEEFAYRIKKGRLEDMGFVDFHEAISLYSVGNAADLKTEMCQNPLAAETKYPPDLGPASYESAILSEELLPTALSGPLYGKGFLKDALAGIGDARKQRILLMELLRCVNAALSADRDIHENLERIAECTERTRSYIELGLTYFSGGILEVASTSLEVQRIEKLFRLGWLAVQDLNKAAQALVKTHGTLLFADADSEILSSLTGRHPTLSDRAHKDLKLEVRGVPHVDNILSIGRRLAALSALARFFVDDLGVALLLKDRPLIPTESGYSRLLTGFFRESAGSKFSAAPLGGTEWFELLKSYDPLKLQKLAGLVYDRCPEGARAIFKERMDSFISDLKFYIQNNPTKKPDPRFFKAVVIE